jgi:UDP-N-acetyl-D-galactosamine dehydrogenase
MLKETKVAVIGLGYVGLPLAVEFGKKRKVIGYDINQKRINEIKTGLDVTLELEKKDILQADKVNYTSKIEDIKDCNVYIIAVPTPIKKNKKPDLAPLISASKTVGSVLKIGDIVIYESTVYPGCTEEDCVPILEKYSNLKYINENNKNKEKGFYCGYSPERINPGDKNKKLKDIKKITSGSTKEAAEEINSLYLEIIEAGTYLAENIKIAEAAKVIENTQRDINIAIINEFSIIFNKMGIDTESVLRAASTKWNFLNFKPGLVGGHCIGIDPYYLTYKSEIMGYEPKLIHAAREINEEIVDYVVNKLAEEMKKRLIKISGSKILIMGMSFKENCTDIRNSRIVNMQKIMSNKKMDVDIFDPWVDCRNLKEEYNLDLIKNPKKGKYDVVVIAVQHDMFKEMGAKKIRAFAKNNGIIYDLKYMLSIQDSDIRL